MPSHVGRHQDRTQQPRRPLEGVIAYNGGCLAFSKELREVAWPVKFNPQLPARFDGTAPPLNFLQLYSLNIQAAREDDTCMANWFPMALKGTALSWLLNLPEGSITSWEELCEKFVANFKGSYKRPLSATDLRVVRQRPDETLCSFI